LIQKGLPGVDLSVSAQGDQQVHITAVNLSAENPASFSMVFADKSIISATGRYICGAVTAHNTFDNPDAVTPQNLEELKHQEDRMDVSLPACAIAAFDVKFRA
jgi:alpha-L-arabinofuranosidase